MLLLLFALLCSAFAIEPAATSPRHVHMSLSSASDPFQRAIMWYTAEAAGSEVEYGVRTEEYSKSQTGTADPVKFGTGYVHRVILSGLKPSQKYYYRVGSERARSKEFTFKTPALDEEVTILAYGDMGTAEQFVGAGRVMATIQEHERTHTDFILHAGDLAYAFKNMTKWDQWFTRIEPISANIPYQVCAGNRDEEEMIAERFYMPLSDGGSKGLQNFYYSFDYSWVHVIALSIKHDYNPGSAQYKWLQDDLRRASSNPNTRWIVLISHSPMYSSSDGHTQGNKEFQAAVEDLLYQYHVSLAIMGDDHNYERSYPVYKNQPDINLTIQDGVQHFNNPNKTIHILAGTGGIALDGWKTPERPPWSATRALANGYVKIMAWKDKMKVVFIDANTQEVLDQFWLWKSRPVGVSSAGVMIWLLPCVVVGFIFFFVKRFYLVVNPFIPKITPSLASGKDYRSHV